MTYQRIEVIRLQKDSNTSEPSGKYQAWMKEELAKSYDLALDPQVPRVSHEDFWAEFENAQ